MQHIIVYTTCETVENAQVIAKTLVEKHLAACVQINPGMTSFYIWEKNLCEDTEVQVVIKTSQDKYNDVEKCIIDLHSYTVPQIVAVDIVQGSKEYLGWMENILGV